MYLSYVATLDLAARHWMHRNDIDSELLYRFFRDEVDGAEAEEVKEWALSSESNGREFCSAFSRHTAITLAMLGLRDKPRPYLTMRGGRKRRRSLSLAYAGTAAVLVLALALAFFRPRTVPQYVTASTAEGERVTLTLADGSRVSLNSLASLTYPTAFHGRERRVKVEGEAYFEVSGDKGRPFVVETFAYDVQVLGTRFGLLAERGSSRFVTTLLEGSVALLDRDTKEEVLRMRPGERAVSEGGVLSHGIGDVESGILWTKGILSLGGLSFGDAIRALEKAFGVDIVIECPTLPVNNSPRMKIRVSDGLSAALDVLSHGADFDWAYIPDDNSYHIYDKNNQ